MLKDRRDYENEDDVDLTEMIQEYSQDNELRRKIDALKKQKEEEKKASQPISVLDQLAGMKKEEPFKVAQDRVADGQGIPDIRVDDTMVDKTRVGFEENDDKTLVIMGKKQRAQYASAFDEGLEEDHSTTQFNKDDTSYVYDDETQEDATADDVEEDDDDNLLSHIMEHRKEKANSEDEQDNTKMNKIITYVIIGIIAVCVLVGAFFGVKYVMNTFMGNNKSKPTETVKPQKDPSKEQDDVTDKPSDSEDAKPKKSLKDNSAKIAQLNKQLDLYQSQLDGVKKDKDSVQKDVDAANKELDGYKSLVTQAATYQQQANDISVANDALKKANIALQNATDDATKRAAQAVVDKANAQLQAALQYGSYDDLLAKAQEKNDEYNTKSTAAKKKRDDANAKLQDLKDKQDVLEKNIASLTTELGKYQ